MNIANHWERSNAFRNLSLYETSCSTDIGFDLVKCRVNDIKVDWDMIERIASKSTNVIDINSTLLERHLHFTTAEGATKPLRILGSEKYSAIIIKYPYFSLKLQSSNIRSQTGIGGKEIMQLCIHIEPAIKCLGNIDNVDCYGLQERTRDIIYDLKQFGIEIGKKSIVLNYAEINRNYPYEHNDNVFLKYFNAAFTSLPDTFRILPQYLPWGALGVKDQSGIFADSSTISIHVYDKIIEIENTNKNVVIESPQHIYRLEFIVKKSKQIERWLGTANLFDLEPYMVENAFYKFLNKYVFHPYNTQFSKFYLHAIDPEGIDTSKKHWTDAFYQEIYMLSERHGIDICFITPNTIKELLCEHKQSSRTIEKNLNRCIKMIVEKSDGQINSKDCSSMMESLLKYVGTELYCAGLYDVMYRTSV